MKREQPPPEPATVYGYVRKSTDDHRQAQTIETQTGKIEAYNAWRFKDEPVTIGQIFHDDISAKTPLFSRPQGKLLNEALKPGDHIVVAKLDRAFRKVLDAAGVIEELEAREVHIHFLDMNVDTSTPMGRAFVHVAATFAELERATIAGRIRDNLATKRANGHATSRHTPIGWMKVHKPSPDNPMITLKYFIPDEDEREVCRAAMDLKATMRWEDIEKFFAQQGLLVRETQQPWNRERIRRGVKAAQEGFPLPRDRE